MRARIEAISLSLAIAVLVSGCASAPAGPRAPWEGPMTPQVQAVEKAVDRAFRRTTKVRVAVAYMDLANGAKVLRNENTPFHAASTMKVAVMMAAWTAVDQGTLAIDQPIAVRNEFRSIVDGSHFHLAPADDADPQLYAAVGTTLPLSELMRHMIVRSSNLATNLLVDELGAARVMEAMRQVGAYGSQVLRGVADDKAFNAGLNNEVDAVDLMTMLAAIARTAAKPAAPAAPPDPGADEPVAPPAFSQRAAAAMLALLAAQEFNEKIPAGLPPGTPVAHKTGDIVGYHHDAAIVSPPGEPQYVLVVLTSGFAQEEAANRFIADLSRGIWDARHQPLPPPQPASPRRRHPESGAGPGGSTPR
jgi:beta-lactamase class A